MKKLKIDKVRASRDGHEFHEAWAARRVLQLLLPKDDLFSVALEGTSPHDNKKASNDTLEVADLTLYYGSSDHFETTKRLEIVQFKYSIGKENIEYRPTDAKKTIEKFSKSLRSYIKEYGIDKVKKKVHFEIITNRPISPDFNKALTVLASKKQAATPTIKSFASQIKKTSRLNGVELSLFASKIRLTGTEENLETNKKNLQKKIGDWSIQVSDARARVGDLRKLVRDKAGSAGEGKNIIKKEDILDVLNLSDEDVLFPTPEGFPHVEKTFPREQLASVLSVIHQLNQPLIIHADGGVGKTVFLQTIASRLAVENEVILFDCFGGGSYRAPEDKRHLPKRGLLHIINKLACLGLCDLVLPGAGGTEDMMTIARKRLTQAASAIKLISPNRNLILILDAIDNAAVGAEDSKEESFPKLLLESLHFNGQIPNLKVIASSRSHRIDISVGQSKYHSFPLESFSRKETSLFLKSRKKEISEEEIEVAFARSDGNARILEQLVARSKDLLARTEIKNKININAFLQKTIDDAVGESLTRGYSQSSINAFLAGLAVLPLPIPISEYASAHGMVESEIESFASDLAPMLERTGYGLMFRDEPTETFIRDKYSSNNDSLKKLSENLHSQQNSSVYAARALPGLLVRLNDETSLISLAFSDQFPASITSKVGQQAIRYSRISATLTNALNKKNFNNIVPLLVELSTLASINNRGADFILANIDLVVASKDFDARRRLFEIRTSWQGTRHSRLAIAHLLSGELGDAYGHASKASRWVDHYFQSEEKDRERDSDRRPNEVDISSMPLCLISQKKYKEAFKEISEGWKAWFSFDVASYTFQTLQMANIYGANRFNIDDMLRFLPGENIPICSAALLNLQLESATKKRLLKKLGKACHSNPDFLKDQKGNIGDNPAIFDGLISAVGISIFLKQKDTATQICSLIPNERPSLWTYTRSYPDSRVSEYIKITCLQKLAENSEITALDFLPKEIFNALPPSVVISKTNYKVELKKYISEFYAKKKKEYVENKNDRYDYEEQNLASRFITERLDLLILISQNFMVILNASQGNLEKPMNNFIKHWTQIKNTNSFYRGELEGLVDPLCRVLLLFVMEIRTDISKNTAKKIIELIDQSRILSVYNLIDIISIFSIYDHLHEYAGMIAVKVVTKIDGENDVSERASLYARLSRAIMPASLAEMTSYFRKGLDQVDMIGSGDYKFNNELLLFANSVSNGELAHQELHTLTNISELNIDDDGKFPWYAFGLGVAKIGGIRILSKIARWDDRSKVKLEYTLLPSVIALVKYKKLPAEYALSVMRLCDPYETWDWDIVTLAEEIFKLSLSNDKELLLEFLEKFESDNPKTAAENQLSRLIPITIRILGENSEQVKRLKKILSLSANLRDENNHRSNYRNKNYGLNKSKSFSIRNKSTISKVLENINPINASEINDAYKKLHDLDGFYQEEVESFFKIVRDKVNFSQRGAYVKAIGTLEDLKIHSKLKELFTCRDLWKDSSISFQQSCHDIGLDLVSHHAEELTDMDYLYVRKIQEISDLSKISMSDLLIQLVKSLKNGESNIEASIWMSIATLLSEKTKGDVSRDALIRLLKGGSAKLSSSATDGDYKEGLYTNDSPEEAVASLIWMRMGSSDVQARWSAVHSLLCLAKLGAWEIIDLLVSKMFSEDAQSFQASELSFYFLHARLWLLIALSRAALDHPDKVFKYKNSLAPIVLSKTFPHVLMKHYAAMTLLNAMPFVLSNEDEELKLAIASVNESPLPQIKESMQERRSRNSYKETSEVVLEFHTDMDFDKYHITPLGNVFGKSRSQIENSLTSWVRKYDSSIASMYDNGGRNVRRSRSGEMDFRYHPYGYYLGWHSLFLTAGELLSKSPVIECSYSSDPWNDWIHEFYLTKRNGRLLSDGRDYYPLDIRVNLLETKKKGLAITGDEKKILQLIGINSTKLDSELLIDGYWKSMDELNVRIASTIVTAERGEFLAKKLARTDPFDAWIPTLDEYVEGNEFSHNKHDDFSAWIVRPTSDVKFDKDDPYGVRNASARSRFTKEIIDEFDLKKTDTFGRIWSNKNGEAVARSESWGHLPRYKSEQEANSRLLLSTKFLKQVLKKLGKELIILVNIQRYEEGDRYDRRPSKFSNSTAVIRVNENLDFEYYKGFVNKLQKNGY